jgi:fructose-specific phosphotransferase system IIA component
MRITEILSEQSILLGLECDEKEELLDKMIDLAYKTGKIKDKDKVRKEVWERENIMSTGVGRGIALPHAKTSQIESPTGALAVLSQPVDFASLDDKPVKYIFLLLGRENEVTVHLKLLGKISRLMNSDTFRNNLEKCKDGKEVIELFNNMEDVN